MEMDTYFFKIGTLRLSFPGCSLLVNDLVVSYAFEFLVIFNSQCRKTSYQAGSERAIRFIYKILACCEHSYQWLET